MSDQHPAEQAFDEVMDELASEYDALIGASGASEDPGFTSVPDEYVGDGTL